MKDMFKKYGVLIIVTIFFIGIIAYFGYDKTKNVIPGKTANGEDVVFSINSQDITANQFYDELYNSLGIQTLYQQLEKAVVSQSVEATDDMKATAQALADNVISSYQSQFGSTYSEELGKIMKSLGYSSIDDLPTYLLEGLKKNELIKSYIDTNKDTIYTPYAEAKSPRILSHILVKTADVENLTEEEKTKMADIEKALADGTPFAEVATTYSDDTASAVEGGSLGFTDADTQFVEAFLTAALALNQGEQSDWVKSEYGYHLILCDSTDYETFKGYDNFYTQLTAFTPEIQPNAVWEKANELGIDFKDNAEVKTQLLEYMGITE